MKKRGVPVNYRRLLKIKTKKQQWSNKNCHRMVTTASTQTNWQRNMQKCTRRSTAFSTTARSVT
ncbi:Hypothetical protein PHPALM_1297, partial [Phytophthora palmivora]